MIAAAAPSTKFLTAAEQVHLSPNWNYKTKSESQIHSAHYAMIVIYSHGDVRPAA